jgi:hypothetical protein
VRSSPLLPPAMLACAGASAILSRGTTMGQIHPWLALGVLVSTAATDAVYVMFSSAVAARRRVPAATWSSVWYLLSAFAVISYTRTWVYVIFAALGSWIGAYLAVSHSARRGKSLPDVHPEHRG